MSDDNASGSRWEPGTTPAGTDPVSPGEPGDFAGDEDGDGQLPQPPGQQPDGSPPDGARPDTGSGTESGLTESSWYVVPSGPSVST